MADPVPTVEPTQFHVGDSLQWDKSLADYPASAWTLTYKLIPQTSGDVRTITATASSTDHQVRVTAATTAAWTAGDFWLIGYATDGTDRFEIYNGPVTVLANPATATSYDGRSYLQRILDILEAAIEANEIGRNVIRYSYGGAVSEVRTIEDALKARDRIKSELANETAANSGQQRRILTRFRCPR